MNEYLTDTAPAHEFPAEIRIPNAQHEANLLEPQTSVGDRRLAYRQTANRTRLRFHQAEARPHEATHQPTDPLGFDQEIVAPR